jgi:coenzyme PQQ precursor peptide PqqA
MLVAGSYTFCLPLRHFPSEQEIFMKWTTPEFCDLRFGFEITMYIANR